MGAGKLCLPLLQVTCSAHLWYVSLSCQQCSSASTSVPGSSFIPFTTVWQGEGGGLPVCQHLGVSETQVACPSHTAREDQSRISPRCDSERMLSLPLPASRSATDRTL